jgi:5-methylcytosine-specific restriction endonuclease McrA
MSVRYSVYIHSDAWKIKRLEAISRAGGKCQLCGKPSGSLHVHHNTYERLGNERPEDLIALCPPCHNGYHSRRAGKLDVQSALTPGARKMLRRLNLEPQSVPLTAGERQRRQRQAVRFIDSIERRSRR